MSETISINGKDYDAYVTVEAVDDYANGSMNASAWQALTEDDKGRAVVTSTRWIDSQCWQGAKVDDAQPLQFPRVIGEDTVLAPVEQACILLSILVAANPELADQMTGNVAPSTGETKRLKAGSVEIEYFRNLNFIIYGNGSVSPFPQSVMALIGKYLCAATGGANWGNAGASSFGTCAPAHVGRKNPYGMAGPI